MNSWLWIGSQPFASIPGIFGSYQATLGGVHDEGAAIARAALVANPNELMLYNNLAYCLLQLGHLEEAETEIGRMEHLIKSDSDKVFLHAIRGLREFKHENFEVARSFYRQADELTNDETLKAVAAITRARDELRAGTKFAVTAVDEALVLARRRVGTKEARVASMSLLVEQLADDARAYGVE